MQCWRNDPVRFLNLTKCWLLRLSRIAIRPSHLGMGIFARNNKKWWTLDTARRNPVSRVISQWRRVVMKVSELRHDWGNLLRVHASHRPHTWCMDIVSRSLVRRYSILVSDTWGHTRSRSLTLYAVACHSWAKNKTQSYKRGLLLLSTTILRRLTLPAKTMTYPMLA